MKKILLILMAVFAFGLQNVSAQDAMKIVTNHPDFQIKITRCAAIGKTLYIDMTFQNLSSDDVDEVSIMTGWQSGFTEAYDNEGNLYRGREYINAKIANDKEYGWSNSGTIQLISGVPFKAGLRINNFSTAAETIAKLRLCVKVPSWGLGNDKPVIIRNIPISRQ